MDTTTQFQYKEPIAGMEYPVNLGSSFNNSNSSKIISLSYSIPPNNMDRNSQANIVVSSEGIAKIEAKSKNNDESKPVMYNGTVKETKNVNCVLIFDGSSFTLERLASAVVQLKHKREEGVKKTNSKKALVNSLQSPGNVSTGSANSKKRNGGDNNESETKKKKKKIGSSSLPIMLPSSPSSTASEPNVNIDEIKNIEPLLSATPMSTSSSKPPLHPNTDQRNNSLSTTTTNKQNEDIAPKIGVFMGLDGKPIEMNAVDINSDEDEEEEDDEIMEQGVY